MTKEKFVLEFDLKSTPVTLLWSYLATANGLKEWFADNVSMSGKSVNFIWNGVPQEAHIIAQRTQKYVRYHWVDDVERTYFELKISVSEMTDNVLLTVTDFAEPDEMEEAKDLWVYQIDSLRRLLGC